MSCIHRLYALSLLVLSFLIANISLPGLALSQSSLALSAPSGNEFQVNTTTDADQTTNFSRPEAVAMDSAGDFVVTWASKKQNSNEAIYAQRYNAAGTP